MERLKLLRLEHKLTQIALQMKTGIDQALLSKYETGERLPTFENLCVLADFFGTSLDYLAGRTDVRAPYPNRKYGPMEGVKEYEKLHGDIGTKEN